MHAFAILYFNILLFASPQINIIKRDWGSLAQLAWGAMLGVFPAMCCHWRKCKEYSAFQHLGEKLDKLEGKDRWKRSKLGNPWKSILNMLKNHLDSTHLGASSCWVPNLPHPPPGDDNSPLFDSDRLSSLSFHPLSLRHLKLQSLDHITFVRCWYWMVLVHGTLKYYWVDTTYVLNIYTYMWS